MGYEVISKGLKCPKCGMGGELEFEVSDDERTRNGDYLMQRHSITPGFVLTKNTHVFGTSEISCQRCKTVVKDAAPS